MIFNGKIYTKTNNLIIYSRLCHANNLFFSFGRCMTQNVSHNFMEKFPTVSKVAALRSGDYRRRHVTGSGRRSHSGILAGSWWHRRGSGCSVCCVCWLCWTQDVCWTLGCSSPGSPPPERWRSWTGCGPSGLTCPQTGTRASTGHGTKVAWQR